MKVGPVVTPASSFSTCPSAERVRGGRSTRPSSRADFSLGLPSLFAASSMA
jgi:hypothetical protein